MPLWRRIANIFRGEALNREIDEELEAHVAEAIAAGRDPVEARRAFGSALRHRDESRDFRVIRWMDALRADAVFGWRQIGKSKITSMAAILSLALGIGACTAAFRLIDALLLRPLPVANAERLHLIAFEGTGPQGNMTYDSCSYPMFRQMRADVKEQADLIAVSYADRLDLTYGSDQEMEKEYVQFVSGSMFNTFGIRPAAGRLFSKDDDGEPGATRMRCFRTTIGRGGLGAILELWGGQFESARHLTKSWASRKNGSRGQRQARSRGFFCRWP
jgi:hypothetical protein